MNTEMDKLVDEIRDALIKRAKFISENSQHLAPLGQRSAALQLFDAKLYLAMLSELQQSGKKTTADERDAMFEGVKETNLERNVILLSMLKTNEALSLMDAEIEYLRRRFDAKV